MNLIKNYNHEGLCAEELCAKRYTHYSLTDFYGFRVYVCVCESHFNKIFEVMQL